MAANGYKFTAAELKQRASARLLDVPPALDAAGPPRAPDGLLDPAAFRAADGPVRLAAVLVPIRDEEAEPRVIFTERSTDMPAHAGQICFPGGRLAEPAETPLEAALREAEEEIGLDRTDVTVLGFLDSYRTGTGYLIAPVVAMVRSGFTPVIEEREVASVFEVPLGFLMNPINHRIHQREWRGGMRRYHAMPWQDRYIWGATAGMLKNLYDRVYAT